MEELEEDGEEEAFIEEEERRIAARKKSTGKSSGKQSKSSKARRDEEAEGDDTAEGNEDSEEWGDEGYIACSTSVNSKEKNAASSDKKSKKQKKGKEKETSKRTETLPSTSNPNSNSTTTALQHLAPGSFVHILFTSGKDISAMELCSLCGGRGKDAEDHMLWCEECSECFHDYCLDPPIVTLLDDSLRKRWRCANCKFCEGCRGAGDANLLLICENCDRGWHTYCLEPALESVPEGNWFCTSCADRRMNEQQKSGGEGEEEEVNGKCIGSSGDAQELEVGAGHSKKDAWRSSSGMMNGRVDALSEEEEGSSASPETAMAVDHSSTTRSSGSSDSEESSNEEVNGHASNDENENENNDNNEKEDDIHDAVETGNGNGNGNGNGSDGGGDSDGVVSEIHTPNEEEEEVKEEEEVEEGQLGEGPRLMELREGIESLKRKLTYFKRNVKVETEESASSSSSSSAAPSSASSSSSSSSVCSPYSSGN